MYTKSGARKLRLENRYGREDYATMAYAVNIPAYMYLHTYERCRET